MDVNYEVWGAPEEWQDISDYSWANLAECKIPKSGRTTYYRAYDAGALEGGVVPTDLSLSYWGIGEGSILAHPMYLSPYWDGDVIKTAVNEVQKPKTVPCILNWASDPSGTQADMSWYYRYAPTDTPGQDSWRAQNLIATTAYSRLLIASFNYQKVYLIPYVKVAAAGSSSWGRATLSLKEYMDGMTDGGTYVNYDKVIGIGYQIAIGDGINGNRSTGNKEMGIVFPVSFEASQRSYQSGSRTYTWFATRYGIEALMTNFTLNYYTHSITPYREWNSEDFSSQHLVGDADTGWRRKYCQNYYAGGNIYGQVPIYYYNPDDEIWKINDSTPWNANYADPFPYIECTPSTKDAVKDYIMKQIAYLGFPFMYDPALAARGQIGDTGVFLPEFDDDGITTGNYAEGRAALRLVNSEWTDAREGSGYDPTKPTGGDEDEGIKIRPSTPAFTLAGHGTKCYALVESDIDEIFDDIYGRSSSSWSKLIKGLQMFGADPMGAIISFKWYPYSFSSTTNSAVYLGNTAINPLHQYPVIDATTNSYKSTTATYKWDVDRNFVNSRKTTCRLYLPFYGFYELPLPLIISKTLSVYMAYNVPDELATWIISFDDVVYDFVECDPSIDIPLTGSNAAQIALTKRNTALSIATQVGATAAAIAVGATMQAPALGAAVGELGAIYSGAGTIGGVIQSLPWLEASSVRALAAGGAAAAGIGAGAVASGSNILNRISNAKMQIGHLMTNLPYHGAASSTTFLNLPMYPYIQFIQNIKMQGWNEAEYKIKVGIACDKWVTTSSMPANSLLQTTGIANMPVNDLELAEVQELNEILQSGFCK